MRKNPLHAAAMSLLIAATHAVHAAPALAGDGPPETLELSFSSFFRHPIGPRGLEVGDALRAADGRRVRLVGYMVAQEQAMPGRFMLTPRPVRMSEHADGEADDLPPATVTVVLDAQQRDRVVEHRPGLMALAGRLSVGREEDSSGRVSWVRLHIEPGAVAESRAGDSTPAHTLAHMHMQMQLQGQMRTHAHAPSPFLPTSRQP